MSGIYCARACTIARRHLTDCEHAQDGQCRGCLPRPADFGALCLPCHFRLVRILHDLPHARVLLAGHLQPGNYARRSGYIKQTQGVPPAPLNLGVLDMIAVADDAIAYWAEKHAEEHQLTRPTDPAAHLRTHLASIECAEWISDAVDDFSDLLRRAHALVPWRAEARRLGAPCPQCHCQALVMYGGDDWVTCQECGGVIERSMYDHWARVILDEQAERQRVESAEAAA